MAGYVTESAGRAGDESASPSPSPSPSPHLTSPSPRHDRVGQPSSDEELMDQLRAVKMQELLSGDASAWDGDSTLHTCTP